MKDKRFTMKIDNHDVYVEIVDLGDHVIDVGFQVDGEYEKTSLKSTKILYRIVKALVPILKEYVKHGYVIDISPNDDDGYGKKRTKIFSRFLSKYSIPFQIT